MLIPVKYTKIRNLIFFIEYNSDISFTIIFIENNKSKKLGPWKIGENIAFMQFDKFLNGISYIKKDVI